MKGNDEITGLFRSRLSGAEMTVRDGFWEELKGDLSRVETDATNTSAATKRSVLTPRFYRVAAAASDRKSTRLNSSHTMQSRMPSSA